MYHVVLPQAWRTILPPVGNEFIALLKDTSLVSILGVADLLRRGREFASESFDYFETFTMMASIPATCSVVTGSPRKSAAVPRVATSSKVEKMETYGLPMASMAL